MYQKVTLRNTEFSLQIHNIRISMYGTVVFKTDASFTGGRGFRFSLGDHLAKFSSKLNVFPTVHHELTKY